MDRPSGLEAYLEQRAPRLMRIAYLLTGDVHAAEDLMQTVLVKIWPRWERIAAVGDPDAYLHTCLVNAFLSVRRRWAAEVPLADPDQGRGAVGPDVETRLLVLRALARLTRRQRATVVLRYFEDLPEREVAERMGCSVGTVKSQTAKALATLRRALDASELEDDHAR